MTHYCWRCYAANERPRGRCVQCGEEIAAPSKADYVDLLIWALQHPLPDRRMLAAQVLGRRREPRAREPLRKLALTTTDPYLAAQALDALVAIDGAEAHRKLLERLLVTGPAVVRRVAEGALNTPTAILPNRHPRQSDGPVES